MKEIVNRYRGKWTAKGHELRVDEMPGQVIIWYLLWGEYEGVDDHHHMGIARIERIGDNYLVKFLRDKEKEPHRTQEYASLDAAFLNIDEAISRH